MGVICHESWDICKRVSEKNDIFAPFLFPCVSALMSAMPVYQAKNLLISYDLLGAMLKGIPPDLVQKVGGQVWPVLLRSLSHTPPDRRLVALLDCIASCALYLSASVAPYAVPLLRSSFQLGLAQLKAASG